MQQNHKALISDDDVAEERLRQLAQASTPATGPIYDHLPLLGFDLTDEMLEELNQRFDLRN